MDSKIFLKSMVTKNWTEDEIEAFALLLYKALIMAHLARVKFKSTDEELQKLSEYLDLKIPIDRLRTNILIFQCSAIDMVASRVRAGHSWRNFWGAPQWTLDLEPSFGIVEKALQMELLSAGPDPLARLLDELAAAGEDAARCGGAGEDAAGALRDLPVARELARVTAVPERRLAAAWGRLCGATTGGASALRAAGDVPEEVAGGGGRLTAAHWQVVDLELYYCTEFELVTQAWKQAMKRVQGRVDPIYGLIGTPNDDIPDGSIAIQPAVCGATDLGSRRPTRSDPCPLDNQITDFQTN